MALSMAIPALCTTRAIEKPCHSMKNYNIVGCGCRPSCFSCMYSTKLSKKAVRFLRTFVVLETNSNRSLITAHATTLYTKELTQPRRGGGGGGGLGCAVPRCRHIGCVVSHGAAAVSCCVGGKSGTDLHLCAIFEACLCFIVLVHLSCVTYVPCATMTWRGGGGGAMARYAMQWFV